MTRRRAAIPLAIALVAGTALALAEAGGARAADSAVVLAYPDIGGTRMSSSVTLQQFEAHIAELKSGRYKVLPLGRIVRALRAGEALPDRAVALTFDSAHRSIYRHAWPRLREAGMPFTVFVPSERVQPGSTDYLDWDELRAMAAAGVTIGSQGAADLRLASTAIDRVAADIARSTEKLRHELGAAFERQPMLFAYPYGEWSAAVAAEVEAAGYVAAFGQHSGVAHASANRFGWPRFLFNQNFGDLERFRTAANALPLPIRDLVPSDPLLKENPPALGFTVDPIVGKLEQFGCFASEQGRVLVEMLGDTRVEVRMPGAFKPGRARVNCTMPGPDGRWRWLGIPLFVPKGS